MSVPRSSIFTAAVGALIALTSGAVLAEELKPSRLGTPRSIEKVRAIAESSDYVTIEGRVLRKRSAQLFELEDPTGLMTVRIPDNLLRDMGTPELDEHIRVQGQYDHKPLFDSVAHPEDTWGIRVQGMERNVPERRPARSADVGEVPALTPRPSPAAVPAEGEIEVMKSNLDDVALDRLQAAAQRVRDAKKGLAKVDAEYARALHQQGELASDARTGFESRRTEAQAELSEARAAIPSLAQEARDAGVSERLIEMYEQQLMNP